MKIDEQLPQRTGHYRVLLDDGYHCKAHWHNETKQFTRFWQVLTRVVEWRPETTAEKRDWQYRLSKSHRRS